MKRCVALFSVFAIASAVHVGSLVADVENDAAEYELKDNQESEQVEMQGVDDNEEEEVADGEFGDAEDSLVEDVEQESGQVDEDDDVEIDEQKTTPEESDEDDDELVEPAELVESTSVSQIAPLNIGKILDMIVRQSKGSKARLNRQRPAQKAKVSVARRKNLAKQKTIGALFRQCKKSISKRSPNLNARQCAIFKKMYYPKARVNFGSVQNSLKTLRRRADADNKAALLRAKNAYKEFQSQIKGCKYKITLLPKVVSKVKPILTLIMGKMKIGTGSSGATAVKSAPKIPDIKTMKKFMNLKLHAAIGPPLTKLFTKVEDKLWTAVRPLVDAVKGVLMTLVGSIPIVGGVLSFVVSNVFERIVAMLEGLVNKKLDSFRELLENKAVGVAMKLIFKTVRGVITFVKRSTGTLRTANHRATKRYNQQICAAYRKAHHLAAKAEVPHSVIVAAAKRLRLRR